MFHGSIVALVTPWADGKVDEKALKGLIDWHVEQGTAAIVPCGTTGESPTFTHDEQHDMIARTVEFAAGRVPVIAGAGSNSTAEAVSLAKAAEKRGADGVLSVTPYYNKPTQEGLFQHYKAVGEHCSLPIVLYNVPGRTGVNLLPDTVSRIAEVVRVDSVKEASGNLDQAQELLNRGIRVLSGEDGLTFAMLCMGGHGVISVVANFAPRMVAEMCAAVADGDLDRGRRVHRGVWELTQAAFSETNPIPAKAAVAALGRCREEYRLPLVTMSPDKKARMLELMRRHGLL